MTEQEQITEFNRVLHRYTEAAINAAIKAAITIGAPLCDERLHHLLWYHVSKAIHLAMLRGHKRGHRWFTEAQAGALAAKDWRDAAGLARNVMQVHAEYIAAELAKAPERAGVIADESRTVMERIVTKAITIAMDSSEAWGRLDEREECVSEVKEALSEMTQRDGLGVVVPPLPNVFDVIERACKRIRARRHE